MKLRSVIILYLTSISFAYGQGVSPEVVSTAGDSFVGSNIQLDWTVGEVAISTLQSTVQITQGFHQPYYYILETEELPVSIGTIKIFPNPTSDWLEMELRLKESQLVDIHLYDMQGKLIWQTTRDGAYILEKKSLQNLPKGSYVLSFLMHQNQTIQTYKIEKVK